MADPAGHALPVTRTARYFTLGEAGPLVWDVWLILHGYGQVADVILRHFAPLVTPERYFVAPEALSRFYLDAPFVGHRVDRVGASWMTRRDREAEIGDNMGYLDRLTAEVMAPVRSAARLNLLGFSQGGAAAARWVAQRPGQAARLVLWGSLPPPELAGRPRPFADTPLTLVHGSGDEYIAATDLEGAVARLAGGGASVAALTFAGGHRLDPDVLAGLIGGGS
jgi:predicted esterase